MNKVVANLMEKGDEVYRRFNQNIVKGSSPIIGVRIPELRKIAGKIRKNNLEEFMQEYEGVYFEEKLIKGVIIASDKKLFDEYASLYIKTIDSWCLCDTFCITCKFILNDLEEYYSFILNLLDSGEEFVIRTGIVLLLNYYVNDDYVDQILDICKRDYEFYYVKMAIAWLLSEIYVSYPEKVREFLENNKLDEFVVAKTIEKVNDSFRVSNMEKMRLRRMNLFSK